MHQFNNQDRRALLMISLYLTKSLYKFVYCLASSAFEFQLSYFGEGRGKE